MTAAKIIMNIDFLLFAINANHMEVVSSASKGVLDPVAIIVISSMIPNRR